MALFQRVVIADPANPNNDVVPASTTTPNVRGLSQNATTAEAAASLGYLNTTTGWDPFFKPYSLLTYTVLASAANNNAQTVRAQACDVFKIIGRNAVATPRWLKLFNKATTPNPAADANLVVLELPGNGVLGGYFDLSFPIPLYFPTGLGMAIVANAANLDNTSVAANDILGLNFFIA